MVPNRTDGSNKMKRLGESPRRAVMSSCKIALLGIMPLLLISGLGVRINSSASPQDKSQSAQEGDGSRQIILESFTKARPAKILPKPPVRISRTSRRNPIPKVSVVAPRYNRKTPSLLSALNVPLSAIAEVGLTFWRLRPSQDNDGGARMLIMDGGKNLPWTPERIEIDQLLDLGDRVRMSIESPKTGFLYVIDREQYSDGTLGDPMLIFPTLRTRGGNNRVAPGTLIDIPGQDDSPPFFTLRSNNPKYIGELLTIIVANSPLQNLAINNGPLAVANSQLKKWEKMWSTQAERFDLDGGAGSAWTAAEKAASMAGGARTLTQDEPVPQTVYRVAMRTANGFMVTVPLQRRR